jgi:hypothetical protein
MVTNYPQMVASQGDMSARGETHGEGLGERVFDRLRHLMCGLHGHDTLLQFDHGRMFLRCVSCGHETPGWEVSDVAPPVAAQAEERSRTMARPQLITERRIA